MKRKIISLFAALALVLTMLPSVYAQGETTAVSAPDAKNSIEAQTALYLGLMEPVGGAFLPEEPLTNAQAVVSAAKVLRLNEEDATNIGLFYKDVTAQDTYAPYLMALINQGLMAANGMGNFGPQDPADFTWFSNILIKNAGYDMYRYDAAGITKGVSTREQAASKGRRAKMIYRMLLTKRLEVVGFSGDGQNYAESDKTILEKDYELYTAGGVMEQNEFSSLSSPQSTLGKKEVEIKDAGTFRISDEAMRNYLGCDTEFLYTKENNTIVGHGPGKRLHTNRALSGQYHL